MPKFISLSKNKTEFAVLLILGFLAFVDLSNLDRFLHKEICRSLGVMFATTCPDYYDLPIWEVFIFSGILVLAHIIYNKSSKPGK